MHVPPTLYTVILATDNVVKQNTERQTGCGVSGEITTELLRIHQKINGVLS